MTLDFSQNEAWCSGVHMLAIEPYMLVILISNKLAGTATSKHLPGT